MDDGHSKFVLIHIGAGNHSEKHIRKGYSRLIKDACKEALRPRLSLLASLSECSKIIEASPLTNCSYGSSLTQDGTVINDVCVISKKKKIVKQFGLTAVKNYKYGISRCLNFLMLDEINSKNTRFGITKPNFMIDNNVDYYSKGHGVRSTSGLFDDGRCAKNTELINRNSFQAYNYWKSKLQNDTEEIAIENQVTDTIGVMVCEEEEIACGVCSGGNLFKDENRIGCGSVVGSSCYAMCSNDLFPILQKDNENYYEISMFASGNGEQIICNDICRQFCWKCLLMIQVEKMDIFEVPLRLKQMIELLYVGVIAVISQYENGILSERNILFSHTTESFVFGYSSLIYGYQYCASVSSTDNDSLISGKSAYGILSCK